MHFEEKIVAKCVFTFKLQKHTTEIYKKQKIKTKNKQTNMQKTGNSHKKWYDMIRYNSQHELVEELEQTTLPLL